MSEDRREAVAFSGQQAEVLPGRKGKVPDLWRPGLSQLHINKMVNLNISGNYKVDPLLTVTGLCCK